MSEVGKRGLLDENALNPIRVLIVFFSFQYIIDTYSKKFCKYYIYRIFYKTKVAIRANHSFDIKSCL